MNARIVVGMLASFFVAGCGGRQGASESAEQASTERGGPVGEAQGPKWQWGEVSEDVIVASFDDFGGKADQMLQHRVQFWLDAIDARVRAALHGAPAINDIPKPKAFVTIDDPDAFVRTVPICYDVPVWFTVTPPAGPDQTIAIANVAFDKTPLARPDPEHGGGNVLYNATRDATTCGRRSLTKGDVDDLVHWSNTLSTCQLTRVDNPSHPSGSAVVLGQGCNAGRSTSVAKGKAGAAALELMASGNYVVVTTGMIAEFPQEKDFVPILAHELGHYYSGNLMMPSSRWGYYAERDNPFPALPTPAQDPATIDTLGKVARAYSAADRIAGLASVASQQLQTAVFGPSVPLAQALRQQQSCGHDKGCATACTALFGMLDSADLKGDPQKLTGFFGGGFPRNDLSADKQSAYLAYEQALLQCGAAIPIADSVPAGSAGITSFDIESAMSLGFSLSPTSLSGTVADALHAVDGRAHAALSAFQSEQADAKSVGFGYVTYEQQADNLAVDHLALIGFDPALEVNSTLIDGLAVGPEDTTVPSADACRALATDGFSSLDYMFPGQLSDPHHAHCYRAYNAFRYVQARHPVVATDAVSPPASPAWADVVAKAAKAVASPW
jgi:hypothetical protein